MSKHNQDECPLCQGSGEVDITPIGEPDSERSSYGCPMCIAADRDEAEQQRDKLLAALDGQPQSPVPLTEAELKIFKLGWLECRSVAKSAIAEVRGGE